MGTVKTLKSHPRKGSECSMLQSVMFLENSCTTLTRIYREGSCAMPAKSLRPVRLLVTLLWPARLLCPRILQARTLEWVAISSSRGSSWPRDQIYVSCGSCIGRQILYHWGTKKQGVCVCVCVCVYPLNQQHRICILINNNFGILPPQICWQNYLSKWGSKWNASHWFL